MNTREAMRRTLEMAAQRLDGKFHTSIEAASFGHLQSMRERMDESFSYGKLCRWLGYAQGVLVARGILTLEECKQINMESSDDPSNS